MKNIGLLLFVVLLFIGIDQMTKLMAIEYLKGAEPISYLNDTFRWVYAENSGAFLGMGDSLSKELRFWIFIVAVSVALLGMLIYIFRNPQLSPTTVIAIGLIASGGISNVIDRIFNNGAVIDFMNMGIGTLRTGIFNVADMIILLGVAMIIVWNKE